MQFMIACIQIEHKLQVHMMFYFVSYENSGMEAHRKIHEHPPTNLLQKAKRCNSQEYKGSKQDQHVYLPANDCESCKFTHLVWNLCS